MVMSALLVFSLAAQVQGEQTLLFSQPTEKVGSEFFLGDLDGDGRSDLGLMWWDATYVLHLDGVLAANQRRIPLSVNLPTTFLEFSVIGDADGDGIRDLVFGNANGLNGAGELFLHSGRTGALLQYIAGIPYRGLGKAVAPAGDIDGDGFADFLAAEEDRFFPYGNDLYAFSGRTGAILHLVHTPHIYYAGTPETELGTVGDIDGDGQDDFFYAISRIATGGQVNIFSGATGLALANLQGPMQGRYFGQNVAAAGDINQDGYGDFLVAATEAGFEPMFLENGEVYVYSGRTLQRLWTFEGELSFQHIGTSLLGGKDFDGDGIPDIAYSASLKDTSGVHHWTGIRIRSGRSGKEITTLNEDGSLFGGGSLQPVAEDLNGDGRPDILVNGTPPFSTWPFDYFLYAVGFRPRLELRTPTLSAAAGGSVSFRIDFPAAQAGEHYRLLGSRSGIGPTLLGGIQVPLTPGDRLWNSSLHGALPYATGTSGQLGPQGGAQASLTFPPGAAAPLLGTTLYFAVVTAASPPLASQVSSVVELDILP